MRIVTLAQTVALAGVLGWAAPGSAQDQPGPAAPPQVQNRDVAPAPAPPPQAQQKPPPTQPQAQVPSAPPLQAQQKPPPEQLPSAPPPQAQVPPPPAPPKTTERAQSEPRPLPPPPRAAFSGRYSFNRVDDGFLRLDHATGQIAYCSAHTVGWACQAVSEDRAALEKEIARLQDEVAALKKEVAALREPPPPAAAPKPPAVAPDKNGAVKLPSQEDIARARAYIAATWRRLVDMINQIQQDMMRKRDSDSDNGLSRT